MSRRHPPAPVGLALAAIALAGCGEDPQIEQGLVPFKGTDTSALEPLRGDMMKAMRDRSYAKKAPGDGGPAAAPGAPDRPGPAPGPTPATGGH